MLRGKTSDPPETQVAEQLALSARRRWGLPRGPRLTTGHALLAIGLNLALFFGSFWLGVAPSLGFLPRPYPWILATQAGSVWLAVAMMWCFPRRYSIFHGLGGHGAEGLYRAGERRVWLVAAWFPTLFVFTPYYEFASTVHPWAIMLPGCAVALALFIAAAHGDQELWSDFNRFHLILGSLLCLAYGYATVLQVNCILDRTKPAVYEAKVSAKKGRWHARGLRLVVGPWGPERGSRSLTVPYAVYRSVVPGDRICMVLRHGALGAEWYTAGTCPYDGAPAQLEPGGTL